MICNPWKRLTVDCLGGNGHRIYRDMGWLGGSATGPMLLLLFFELFSNSNSGEFQGMFLEMKPRPPAPLLGALSGDADWRCFRGFPPVLLLFELHRADGMTNVRIRGLETPTPPP